MPPRHDAAPPSLARTNALFHLAVARPQLLAAHLAGYATLLRGEAALLAAVMQRRALLAAACLGCLCVAATLLGTALMLWAVAPPGALAQPWVLPLVPLVPAVAAAWALRALYRPDAVPLWSALQAQIVADAALLDQHAP